MYKYECKSIANNIENKIKCMIYEWCGEGGVRKYGLHRCYKCDSDKTFVNIITLEMWGV